MKVKDIMMLINLKNRILLNLLMMLLSAGSVSAQQFILHDLTGNPIRTGTYENVTGSPYLLDDWSKGTLVLANGDKYDKIMLKLDLVEDMLLYKNEEGKAMESTRPVQEFTLLKGQYVFRNGFAPVDNYTSTSYYQVLVDGETKLLKKSDKVLREEKAYGTATSTKNIIEYSNYYLSTGSKMVKVKNEKSLLEALINHKVEVAAYVKQGKLKLKNEVDMVRVIEYYNTL